MGFVESFEKFLSRNGGTSTGIILLPSIKVVGSVGPAGTLNRSALCLIGYYVMVDAFEKDTFALKRGP